jgi:hypothetical protein
VVRHVPQTDHINPHQVNDFAPGWCGMCQGDNVKKIGEALQLRKEFRGQIAQFGHLKNAQVSTMALDLQLEAIAKAKGEEDMWDLPEEDCRKTNVYIVAS